MNPPNTITLEAPARIGPNAVLQLIATLKSRGFGRRVESLFAAAAVADWLMSPPVDMIDETGVARLHRTVRGALTEEDAQDVMAEAGRRTADYLLANRIPKPAQTLLRFLPARLAA